ncbi:hypothetical protein [Candidatus Williamhamiltonella defendens]|nr:hypothetical protein [Candidatus Hamiltonella defensa]
MKLYRHFKETTAEDLSSDQKTSENRPLSASYMQMSRVATGMTFKKPLS